MSLQLVHSATGKPVANGDPVTLVGHSAPAARLQGQVRPYRFEPFCWPPSPTKPHGEVRLAVQPAAIDRPPFLGMEGCYISVTRPDIWGMEWRETQSSSYGQENQAA